MATIRKLICSKRSRIAIDFIIIIIVTVIIFRNFIFSGGWPGGGDVLAWVAREYLFGRDFRWLKLWRPYSFGFVEGIQSTDFFLMLINSICRSGAVTIKVFMIFSFLFAGLSMYMFAFYYINKNLAALSAALVYVLNRWYFTQLTEAHISILFGYAMAPLLFLLLDRALRFGRLKDLVIFGIGLSICVTGFNPQSVVIYMSSLVLFVIFYVLTPTNEISYKNRLKRFLKVFLFSGGMLLLLSSFYFVPIIGNIRAQYLSPKFGYDVEEAFPLSYRRMKDAFVLGGIEHWGYEYLVDVSSEVSLQILPVSTILFFIFLISYSTIFFKTDRYTLYFLIASLVSMFIAKGPYPPFEKIFVRMWFNIPHFAAFRATNRSVMITALCHAFFVAVLVSMITTYILKKKPTKENWIPLEMNTKPSQTKSGDELQTTYISFYALNKVIKRIKKFLHYFFVLLFILILSSGFFSCWFFLMNGLQVYHPPQNFLSPNEWIENKQGDFKVVSAARSPSEWRLLPNAKSDFSSDGMITSFGWGRDIGQLSTFIHDKPILHDGGWMPRSRAFVDHLRFQEVQNSLTDQLLRILGLFNYRYVILPPYISGGLRSFFLNQSGGKPVYNQSGSVILENIFHQPRIFGVSIPIFVVGGGFKSIFTMSKIPYLNFTQIVPIFITDQETFNLFSKEFGDSNALLFVDSDLLDLVMSSSDEMNVIPVARYGASSRNYTSYWAESNSWQSLGLNTGATLTTYGSNRISVPFEVKEDGNHVVMVRLGFRNNVGVLAIHVDGIPIKNIYPISDTLTKLKWVNLGSIHLEKGKHQISFTNHGPGWNDISTFAVVKSSVLENQKKYVLNLIQEYPGRIIHIISGDETLSHRARTRGWRLVRVPYQGLVWESDAESKSIVANTTIVREGRYMFEIRLANSSHQENPNLKVDNMDVPLQLFNSSRGITWYEGGPIYLNVKSHQIEVGAPERIGFDQMIIHSLKDEEKIVSPNGFEFHTDDDGLNVSPEGNASASSVGVWSKIRFDASRANDGGLNTRWASKPHKPMPQWLQIEWDEPQELNSVEIIFENAIANDYLIQTFNGDNWVNQVNVTENTMLERHHYFPAGNDTKFTTVKTTRLRIYITNVTRLYDLVSIWELKAYAVPPAHTKLSISEDGYYRTAFGLAFGPDYGTFKLMLDNTTTTVYCNHSIPHFRRYDVGSFYLHTGEHNVTVEAIGRVDFAGMMMTLNDEGDIGFLDGLLETKPTPYISYEKINPCKYEVNVKENHSPFLLMFSESHHPLWKAYVGDEEMSPIIGYGLVNIFPLTRTGDYDMTIYFTGQTYANIGLIISTVTMVILTIFLIIPFFTRVWRARKD